MQQTIGEMSAQLFHQTECVFNYMILCIFFVIALQKKALPADRQFVSFRYVTSSHPPTPASAA